MKNPPTLYPLYLATALLFAAAAPVSYADEGVWKIGALVCLTGDCAADGDSTIKGAQIAIDEIEAKGGVLGKRIVLVAEDTTEAVSGAKAVTGYRRLRLDKDIQYIIGPSWTPGGLSLVPVLKKDQDIIITSPSLGVSEFHEAGDHVFNMRGTDEVPTRRAAHYAYEQGIRRVAIFSSEQPWESSQAKFFQDEFEKLGGTIVAKVEPVPTLTGLRTEALKIVSARPEAVFMSVYIQLAIAAKELRNFNFAGTKLAAGVDESRLAEAQGALEGTVFFTYQKPTEIFKEKFQKRFGRAPEIPAATGYDVVYAYAKAVEDAKAFDVNIVKKSMIQLDFEGASGRIRFDEQGCVKKEVSAWKVTGAGYEALR